MFSRQLRQHVSCSWGTKSTSLSLLSALFVTWMVAVSGCSLGGSSVVAEALFQVSGTEPTLAGETASRFNAREYELFQKTQLALVKSDFVLQGAIRDPAVASLSILASKPDEVAWVAENLDANFEGPGSRVETVNRPCRGISHRQATIAASDGSPVSLENEPEQHDAHHVCSMRLRDAGSVCWPCSYS